MITVNTAGQRQQSLIKQTGVISSPAARWSFISAITSLVLIAILHFVKPEMEPSWHMVSEYAIGENGWVMKLAFFAWAIACIGLATALRTQVKTAAGKVGLVLLFLVGISLIMAGVFVMDSPMTPKEELTTHGNLHGFAAMIGIPGQPIAAMLVGLSLRRNTVWVTSKRSVMWTAHFTWISFVIMLVSMFIMLGKTQGQFGPDTLIGWQNRLLVFAYCLWIIITSKHAIRLSKEQNKQYG